MKNIKFTEQLDETDCAPACLSMILNYYGKKVSNTKLRDYTKTDKNGTSIYGISQGCKKLGFDTNAFELDSIEELEELKVPMIAHVLNDMNYEHYVIIEKFDDNFITIVDPAKGKNKIKVEEFKKKWSKVVIEILPNENFNTENDDISIIDTFKSLFKDNKKIVSLIISVSILVNAFSIISAFYFLILIDNVIPNNAFRNLHIISLGFLIIYLFESISSLIRGNLVLYMSAKIDLSLMKKYFQHILNLKKEFFDTRKTGEIVSRFVDISIIRDTFSTVTLTLFVDILMILVTCTVLFFYSSLLFLFTLFIIPAIVIIVYIFRKPFSKYNRTLLESQSNLNSYIIENINGIDVIKSYNAQNNVILNGKNKFNNLISNYIKIGKLMNYQNAFIDFSKSLGTLFILWTGSYLVMSNIITLGELLTLSAVLAFLLDPLERIANLQGTIQSSIVAARRFGEIVSIETENTKSIQKNFKFQDRLVFQNVNFAYGFNDDVLKNINVEIKKGEKIGVTGSSGSGKSTLAKLLLRQYEEFSGEILIDNENLKNININELRSKISYISQNNFVFGASIKDNLLFGVNHNMEKVIDVCKRVGIHSFIKNLNYGYDTILEANGENLSGGQIQRISIARALIKDADIYIFDEPTSSLDAETERLVQDYIENIDGKTIIIISHNLNFIKNLDRILVIENGQLNDNSAYIQLMQNENAYNKMNYKRKGGENFEKQVSSNNS